MIITKGFTKNGIPFSLTLENARVIYRDACGNEYQYNSEYYATDDISAFLTIKSELIAAGYRLT